MKLSPTKRSELLLWSMTIIGFILLGIAFISNATAHDDHLAEAGTLTNVEMKYCPGYVIIDTKELGPIAVYKDATTLHGSPDLHWQKIEKFNCNYRLFERRTP